MGSFPICTSIGPKRAGEPNFHEGVDGWPARPVVSKSNLGIEDTQASLVVLKREWKGTSARCS